MSLHPKYARTDIWREGKYLDVWSVPHFLSGLVLGTALYFTQIPTIDAIIIAFLLLVMYEMWEDLAEIKETRWNKFLDVVVGMSSCVPALLYASRFPQDDVLLVFVVAALADGILSFFGWRASQKASAFEAKMRTQFLERREHIMQRVHEQRSRWKKSRR